MRVKFVNEEIVTDYNDHNDHRDQIKIIIEDLVSKMRGKKEKELPEGTVIRFEIGSLQLTCQATSDGLEINKVDDSIEARKSRIVTVAVAGNSIIVK